MNTTVISLNGQITDTTIFPLNRAFLYGDGFFESFRMRRGEILFWKHHSARIRNAAHALKIDITSPFITSIENAIKALYNAVGTDKQYRGRITVFRHGTGLYAPESNQPEFVVQLMEVEGENFILNKNGLLVDLFHGLQKPVNMLSPYKTLNALPFVLAGIEKKERALDELLILNTNNRLCESSTSNVFCVKGDQILTPSSAEGCVNGVMRAVLLEHGEGFGFHIRETSLTTLDLYECDELFLTNAARGIQWIMGFRNKRYFNKVSDRLVTMINELVQ